MNGEQKVLVSFVGTRDPYWDSREGPILTLLKERKDYFNKLILLYTRKLEEKAEQIRKIITERYPEMALECYKLNIPDPTSYADILRALRPALRNYCHSEDKHYICVSPGTPQMHACWLLLAASGETTATLLQVRNPNDVKEGEELVREVNPRPPEFPRVLQKVKMEEAPEVSDEVMEEAIVRVGIVGRDTRLKEALRLAARVAQYDKWLILILGETGTGKELFAKYMHELGKRKSGPFIAVNCAGLPETLIESELFGYAKGAFTGAIRDKQGKFQAANTGILFLDEIGDMPLSAQAKVLRAIQYGEVIPVGSTKPVHVDVKIIAATNKDLKGCVEEGTFRRDLYYRLEQIVVRLPSLAERRDDIPAIAQELFRRSSGQMGKNVTPSQECLERLKSRPWPGNIRELQNVIYRSVMLAEKEELGPEDLVFYAPDYGTAEVWIPEPHEGFNMPNYFDAVREHLTKRALDLTGGNQSQAAKLLGITSQAISDWLKKHSKEKEAHS